MLAYRRGDKAERLSRGGCFNTVEGTKRGDLFASTRAELPRKIEEKF